VPETKATAPAVVETKKEGDPGPEVSTREGWGYRCRFRKLHVTRRCELRQRAPSKNPANEIIIPDNPTKEPFSVRALLLKMLRRFGTKKHPDVNFC